MAPGAPGFRFTPMPVDVPFMHRLSSNGTKVQVSSGAMIGAAPPKASGVAPASAPLPASEPESEPPQAEDETRTSARSRREARRDVMPGSLPLLGREDFVEEDAHVLPGPPG